MSDHSISIVPRLSRFINKEKTIDQILEWLVSLDIVKPTLSDCVLSSNNGYAISNGAMNVTKVPEILPFDLITNGLEIITERQIFHTGENGIQELICPNCNSDLSSESWDFLNEWDENNSDNLTCPSCNGKAEIHNFRFTPQWGFSDLGFTFWNWSELKEDFVNEFKQKLNCDINVVLTKI